VETLPLFRGDRPMPIRIIDSQDSHFQEAIATDQACRHDDEDVDIANAEQKSGRETE
jgi:hypothetical protein